MNPTTLNTLAFGYIGYDLTTGTPVLDASGKPICLSQFINVQDPPNQCYLEDFNVSDGNNNSYSPTSASLPSPAIHSRPNAWISA